MRVIAKMWKVAFSKLAKRGVRSVGSVSTQPFDRTAVPEDQETAHLRDALQRAGVRLFPYPFSHAVSIVSDCDYSVQRSACRIVQTLCYELNLDFADSFYLFEFVGADSSANFFPGSPREGLEAPLFWRREQSGFAPRQSKLDATRRRRAAVSPEEFGKLFKLGFFDHIHGLFSGGRLFGVKMEALRFEESGDKELLAKGLRVCLLDCLARMRNEAGVDIGSVSITSVQLECEMGRQQDPPLCRITRDDGSTLPLPLAQHTKKGEGVHAFDFRIEERALEGGIDLRNLEAIHFCFGSKEARESTCIRSCTILPVVREDIKKANEELGAVLPSYPTLFVDHSATGLLNFSAAKAKTELRKKANGIACSFGLQFVLGDIDSDAGTDSLLLDSPKSALYAFDLLCEEGIRFVNPSGTSGQPLNRLDPLKVLARSYGRDHRPVYVARRICPEANRRYLDPSLSEKLKRKSRVSTFSARLATVLETLRDAEEPIAVPFYTHLGADQECENRPELFDPDVIGKLQDRLFNFSGSIPESQRVYVVRASAFYEYLRILSVVGPNIERKKGGRIVIRQCTDPHLGIQTPQNPCELHGLTIQVQDASLAKVFLEGKELTDLLRTGRTTGCSEEWVTVLSGGIRQRVSLPLDAGRRGVSIPNLIGNIYYVGIDGLSGNASRESDGIRLSGAGGLSLMIGTPDICAARGASGFIEVSDWKSFGDSTAWFSLCTATWCAKADEPVPCFGDTITVQWMGRDAETKTSEKEIHVTVMKPSSMFQETVDPGDYTLFPFWFRAMTQDNLALGR